MAIKAFTFGLCTVLSVTLLLTFEAWLAYHRPMITSHDPPPTPIHIKGNGSKLLYVVMGDSTAAGRGADADRSIAIETARHLAKSHDVTLVNLGASGARINDLITKQLTETTALNPDVVLLSAGANDVIRFTPDEKIKTDLNFILSALTKNNPNIVIVVPGSGDVGSCPRFEQPLRFIGGLETNRVNRAIETTTKSFPQVTWIPLADRTSQIFKQEPSLFSEDKFHPNDRGYAIWVEVFNEGLDKALSH